MVLDHKLVGHVRSELDRIYNADYIPTWRKHGIAKRVGAMLNNGDYKNMTLYELRELAKHKGISNYSHVPKEGIVYALENNLRRVPSRFEEPSERFNVEADRYGREVLRSRGDEVKLQEQHRSGVGSGVGGSNSRVGSAYRSRELNRYQSR
jgi:hypothetical protein